MFVSSIFPPKENLPIFGDSNAVDSCPGLGVRKFITAELPGGSYRICEFRKANLAAIASGLVAAKAYGAWGV